uniref:3-hydroxyacyl-CoA dehydrogenase n=1 Tax=Anopheles dirus TaxID=7168 RepID=A0A182N3R1_9DIPT
MMAMSVMRSFTRNMATAATINNVVVVGGGLMGSGIAQVAAATGHNVTLVEMSDALVGKAIGGIRKSLERVAKKKFQDDPAKGQQFIDGTLAKIGGATQPETAVQGADLVVEAIVERMEVKHALFGKLDTAAPAHTIFASNTSSLSIAEIGSVTKRQDRFGGLHFFNPVPVMKLLEIIRTDQTSDATFQALQGFGQRLGKACITCKDTPGFVVNRLLVPYMAEAIRLLERGDASPRDIDTAMKLGAGYPMGPIELIDYVGLDTTCNILQGWHEKFPDNPLFVPIKTLQQLVADDKLGVKSGEGFYSYKKKCKSALQPHGKVSQFYTRPYFVRVLAMASSKISHVTVIGGGVMGSGIAMITAANGYRVTVVDVSEEALGRARRQVEKDLQRTTQYFSKGNDQVAEKLYSEATARLKYSTNLKEVAATTDLVIEAIVENLQLKQSLFKTLDQVRDSTRSVAPPHTILATNTSSLSVAEIGLSAERKDRIGGLHFFNPVPLMRLIEVVRTGETSDGTHETLLAFGKSLRKTCITCRDTPGFVVNRLLLPVTQEALAMVERGDASTHDIDVALKLGLGHPMGPFELMDIVGLDTVRPLIATRRLRDESHLDNGRSQTTSGPAPLSTDTMSEWEGIPCDLPAGVLQLENQVAGHTAAQGCLGLLKTATDGTILKPTGKVLCGLREIAFYERLEEMRARKQPPDDLWTTLCQVVPRYHGHPKLIIDGKVVEFVQLEDLTEGLERPCIMDVKIGRRTWDPLATPEKRQAEESKYKACRQRFGLCIPGFQVYSVRDGGQLIRHGKDYGKKLTEANIHDAFLLYLNATDDGRLSRPLLEHFLADLRRIRSWARKQTTHRLYSSSVLLVYDATRLGDPAPNPQRTSLSVQARMIDFAHAFPAEGDDADSVDDNYLQGVESLVAIFEQFLASGKAQFGYVRLDVEF